MTTPRIAILASGNGSTAEAFIHATQDGRVNAEVGLVVCNNPPGKAGIYNRVAMVNHKYGLDIEMAHISGRTHPDGNVGAGQTLAESAEICRRVTNMGVAHVALMGYLKTVRGELVQDYGHNPSLGFMWDGRMSNTHTGPLPETEGLYGRAISQRVLDLGLTQSKFTVNLVSEVVDAGPVIAEHPVDVMPGDTATTLMARVQTMEKTMLPLVINDFLAYQGYGQ